MSASFEFYKLNNILEKELIEAYEKDIEWQNQISSGNYLNKDELEFALSKLINEKGELLEFSTSSSFSHDIEDKLVCKNGFKLEDTYCYFLLHNTPLNCKVMENTEIYQDRWKSFFDENSLLLFTVNR